MECQPHLLPFFRTTLTIQTKSQANNDDFPAIPGNFIDALQNNNSTYNGIPISSNNLRELLAPGPVAAAEMFKIIIEILFSVVLATLAHQFVKKTTPLPDRPIGIFGTPVASAGFVEEQGRGYLHIHVVVWAGFHPTCYKQLGDSKTSNSFSFCHRQSYNSRNKSY